MSKSAPPSTADQNRVNRSSPETPDRPVASKPTDVDTTTPGSQSPQLPHERDQSVDMTDQALDPVMKQAYDDVHRGLVDTDARGSDGKPLGSKTPTNRQ